MDRITLFIKLIERTWEKYGAIEATIEGAKMVDIIVFHLDTS